MKVLHKTEFEEYEICDVTYDSTGLPQFLIYRNGKWVRMSAEHFTPKYYQVYITGQFFWIDDNGCIMHSPEWQQ